MVHTKSIPWRVGRRILTILGWAVFAVLAQAMFGVIMVLVIGAWALEAAGVERAILAFWPHLDKGWVRGTSALIGAALAVLLPLGATKLKEFVEAIWLDSRIERWEVRRFERVAWRKRLACISKDAPLCDLQDIYWEGLDMRAHSATKRGNQKLRDSRQILLGHKLKAEQLIKRLDEHDRFNRALDALEREQKKRGEES